MTDRIRVLHVITRMIVGGAQENTLETVCGLDPAVFETELLCGPQTGPEGSLIEEARQRGARVRVEPSLVREFSPPRDGLALQRLTRLMRDGRYDIVHTHSSKAGILGRLAAGRARVPGVVHTVHGWPFRPNQPAPLRAFYVALERLAAARTDWLVAVTRRDIYKGVKAGVAGLNRFEVVRSAIDVARFAGAAESRSHTRDSWGFGPEVEVVGTVTRLSPQKAPLDFVAAAAEIAANRPDVGFVVVGDGPLRREVERAVRKHRLERRFRLLGIQRGVPELLAGMDLFLLTSLWEGLPRAIVQAMAAGVPVVVTGVDGSSEVVIDGETGRLVPPSDPSATARAALASLNDPGGRASCVAAARALVSREFGLPLMLARLALLYRELSRR